MSASQNRGAKFALPVVSLLVGAIFGVGLALSGMTSPDKVVGFLNFTGNWDPSLMFVMGGAIPVFALGYRLSGRRAGPLYSERFQLPTRRDLDVRLVLGAALFGVGWGLAGICPGPALVSTATGVGKIFVFVAAMAAGMQLAGLADAAMQRRRQRMADAQPSQAPVRV